MTLLLLFAMLQQPTTYPAADGSRVRRPYHYRRHPNKGTVYKAVCRDGAVTFAHGRQGTCSHHGGVAPRKP